MSHFSLAVITRDGDEDFIEKLLSIYYEGRLCAPYVYETKEQYLEKKRKEMEDYKTNGLYAEYIKDPAAYEKSCKNNPGHLEYLRNFMDEYNKTDEELLEDRNNMYSSYNDKELEFGDEYLDKDGNLISYYNPLAKWDWYVVGGRWNGEITTLSGEKTNCAKVGDIDFCLDIDKWLNDPELKKEYDSLVTEGDGFYRAEYFQKRYPTFEDYVRAIKCFSTYAVLDIHGAWHEKGQMYAFGISGAGPEQEIAWDKNYYENFIKELNPEYYITIVDCHI